MQNTKLCLVTDLLQSPFDEGMRVFANSLIKVISNIPETKVLAINCLGLKEHKTGMIITNRFLLSLRLKETIRKFNPCKLIYIPAASSTLNSFIRARLLRLYGQCPVGLVALQTRYHSLLQKKLIRLLSPDIILTQSLISSQRYSQLGIKSAFLNPAVDSEKFIPAGKTKKVNIRKKYGIDDDVLLVLHCGHIKKSRNLSMLKVINNIPRVQAVIVASTSTKKDKTILRELHCDGVIVYQNYIERIVEIYQMSDCYIFPVNNHDGAMEMPLSLLEAMACNLPVLTTRFGGLSDTFSEDEYFKFVNTPEDIVAALKKGFLPNCTNREKVQPFTWHVLADKLQRLI